MSKAEDFGPDLKNAIINADPKLNRHDLLEDIFKMYVAKLLELSMIRNKEPGGRIEFNAMIEIKRNLIAEFRAVDLAEYQKSVEWYEKTFDDTIHEILNDAAHNHQGQDAMVRQMQNLEINPTEYVNNGGLYLPTTMAKG